MSQPTINIHPLPQMSATFQDRNPPQVEIEVKNELFNKCVKQNWDALKNEASGGVFQPQLITSCPVMGYKEIPFWDEAYQHSRKILVWYPVEPETKGTSSPNLWDVFDIAIEAPIANPQSKKPLIVVSHGYRGTPHQLSWLINKLVHNGHVVLGIHHLDELEDKPQINHWKRAQDVHTLLDRFNLQPFAEFTDANCIGFAGFSVGGATGVWLAGGISNRLDPFIPSANEVYPEEFAGIEKTLPTLDKEKMAQNWKDERIKAVFLMAPAWAWIFDENSLQKITVPTYIVATDADNVLVTNNNAGFFSKHIPGSTYQVIQGQANHYVFLSVPKEKDKLPSYLNFLVTDVASVNREWIQFEVAQNVSHFFKSVFSNPGH